MTDQEATRARWKTQIYRFDTDSDKRVDSDFLAVEEPLEIRVAANGLSRPIAITMRTPGSDPELAAGFLFSEGVIDQPDDVAAITQPDEKDNVVVIETKKIIDVNRLTRNFYTSSSCGICGKASLESLWTTAKKPVAATRRIAANVIGGLPASLRGEQTLFDSTGGLHAAALFDFDGGMIEFAEDVGRHNAVDKIIGRSFLASKLPLDDCILFLSGRASFELIQKAVMAGIPIVCAVGAPSSLAVATAREFGVTLCGFVRDGRFNAYSLSDRIETE